MWVKRGYYPKKRYKKIKKRKCGGSSKIELLFGLYLKRIGIEVESQFQLSWRFYDFKVKGKKILIEFDGDYHHANPEKFAPEKLNEYQKKNVENDIYKDFLALKYGYKLIRVWENDFKTSPSEVKEKILAALKEP